jgi:hypothetical protein
MKELEIDRLFRFIKRKFGELSDKRAGNIQFSLGDTLQSGLAMFSLKDSSVLEFITRFKARSENLLRIYKINNCPSDSQMRQIIDEVTPIQIERVKLKLIQKIKTEGILEEFEYFKGWKLLLVDGVHHYSSQNLHCDNCQTTHHQDGAITYSHSMLASVIAHPDKKEVIPLCEEAIVNQDGQTKNDCELNAVKRLHDKVKTRHFSEKFIYVEDALFANGPHIRDIEAQNNRYIIRVKPGSGAGSVLLQYEALVNTGQVLQKEAFNSITKLFDKHGIHKPSKQPPQINEIITNEKNTIKVWRFVNGLYLNEANPDIEVNFLRYEERSVSNGKILKSFDWITNIVLNEYNVKKVTKAGRSRWKIENETFNTLKNQGYHFGHNFGHGHNHLATNLVLLMMLAFLIDQIQQLADQLFSDALKTAKRKKYLWEDIRSFFKILPFYSMKGIYKAIIFGLKPEFQKLDSS